MLLVPGPRAGTPGLRMTHAAVTDLALQLLPCIADLHRTFSLWDDDDVSHGTFTLADLRKALPVVGVSAHPVDVQLLFDALDRHHYGHAAYGALGERLAHVAGMALHHYVHLQEPDYIHIGIGLGGRGQRKRESWSDHGSCVFVAGMVGAPTPSYTRRASLPGLPGRGRNVGGHGAMPLGVHRVRRSSSIDALPSLRPSGAIPGGGFGRDARFGRREDALGGREDVRFKRWEEDPASHGGNHARQGGGGRRRREGRTAAAEVAEEGEGEGDGEEEARAAGEERVPASMVLPKAARLIMQGNQAGDISEKTIRETLRDALTKESVRKPTTTTAISTATTSPPTPPPLPLLIDALTWGSVRAVLDRFREYSHSVLRRVTHSHSARSALPQPPTLRCGSSTSSGSGTRTATAW